MLDDSDAFWIRTMPINWTQNPVAFSLQANYTDRATAACRPSYCQLLWIEGVAWSAQRILTTVNLGFLDRNKLNLVGWNMLKIYGFEILFMA
jgi:hypothetical protein